MILAVACPIPLRRSREGNRDAGPLLPQALCGDNKGGPLGQFDTEKARETALERVRSCNRHTFRSHTRGTLWLRLVCWFVRNGTLMVSLTSINGIVKPATHAMPDIYMLLLGLRSCERPLARSGLMLATIVNCSPVVY